MRSSARSGEVPSLSVSSTWPQPRLISKRKIGVYATKADASNGALVAARSLHTEQKPPAKCDQMDRHINARRRISSARLELPIWFLRWGADKHEIVWHGSLELQSLDNEYIAYESLDIDYSMPPDRSECLELPGEPKRANSTKIVCRMA